MYKTREDYEALKKGVVWLEGLFKKWKNYFQSQK